MKDMKSSESLYEKLIREIVKSIFHNYIKMLWCLIHLHLKRFIFILVFYVCI